MIAYQISERSRLPKYQQIINSVVSGIENRSIKLNDKLLSINEVSITYDVSRDTVEKAYNKLKSEGVIVSVPGKGYYICMDTSAQRRRILLLIDELTPHKRLMQRSFLRTIGDEADVDFFVYNGDYQTFRTLLMERVNSYSHFVIVPHFRKHTDKARDLLNTLPKDKLVILNHHLKGIDGEYACLVENYEYDLREALVEALPRLARYQRLKVVFPDYTYHARDILKSFQRFCLDHKISGKVVSHLDRETFQAGDVFVTLTEDDLLTVIKRIRAEGLVPGDTVGLISYNDSPLKEVLLEGITVVSTDFNAMGRSAARMILRDEHYYTENPFGLTLRATL